MCYVYTVNLHSIVKSFVTYTQMTINVSLKPSTHLRQSRLLPNRRQSRLVPIRSTLLPIRSTLLPIRTTLLPIQSTLSPVLATNRQQLQFDSLSRSTLSRSTLSPTWSTLSPESRTCFRLCGQCVWGQSDNKKLILRLTRLN